MSNWNNSNSVEKSIKYSDSYLKKRLIAAYGISFINRKG